MAQPWPHIAAPTLTRLGLQTREERTTPGVLTKVADRLRVLAGSPTIALVVMALGLLGLFVLPTIGLPFVALVVLPVIVYQLRAEQRRQYRLDRR